MAARNRDALLFLAAAALSYAGTAIVPVAISFAVLETGHGAGSLGLVLAAQTVPTIMLLVLGGIAGDRWSRRTIMMASDFFRALAQASLAAWLILGHAPLAIMVIVSTLIGIGNAFFQPASGGLLAELAVREELGRYNGLLRTANALAMVIGPALGGVIVSAIGPGWGIALDAASYVASGSCLLAIHPGASRGPAGRARTSTVHALIEAAEAVRQTRWLALLLAQYAVLNMTAIAPINVIGPVVLSKLFAGSGDGARAWGMLLAAIGGGAVLGALGCARRQPRRLLLGIEAAALMLAAPMLLLAMPAPFAIVAVGAGVFGVGAAMLSVLTMTAIQKTIDTALLSRTMAIVQLVNIGLLPVGYVLAGPSIRLFGAQASLALSGAIVIASVAVMCVQPRIRRFAL